MSAATADEAVLAVPEVPPRRAAQNIVEEAKPVEEETKPTSEGPAEVDHETPKDELVLPEETTSDDKRQSFDPAMTSPETLAQLRQSLVDAQSETSRLRSRNVELEDELAETSSKLTDLETQRTFLSAAKEAVETELKEEKRKREAAEENVEMLRGKVEDARKAIGTMRMGQEDKRTSSAGYGQGIGLGFGGAGADGLLSPDLGSQEEMSGKRVKRASLLFNQGARRISTGPPGENNESPVMPASNSRTGLRELRLGTIASSTSPTSSPKISTPTNAQEFGDNPELTPKDPRQRSQSNNLSLHPSGRPTYQLSDPYGDVPLSAASTSSRPRPGIAERLSSLTSVSDLSSVSGGNGGPVSPSQRQYVNLNEDDNTTATLTSEVTALKNQLAEAHEARMASEECLKALREFIAMQNGGSTGTDAEGSSVQGIKLPPLPTDRESDEDLAAQEAARSAASAKKSGWGFNMWGAAPANATSSTKAASGHRVSRSNSLATSIRSEAGDIPSADSSVRNAQLEPLRIPQNEPGMKSSASSTTPLSNFVSSWSRGISGGAPASAASPPLESAVPASGSASAFPGLAKRGFSFFGSKSNPAAVDDVKREAEEAAELEKVRQTPEAEMDKDENALRRQMSDAHAARTDGAETRGSVELDIKKDGDETLLKTSSTMKDEKYETVAL